VYVNGFRMPAAKVTSVNNREAQFEVNLLMTRAEENRVRINLTGAAPEASSQQEMTLACRDPDTLLRGHLLILSPGEEDKDALTERVKRAFNGPPRADRPARPPAFTLQPPLVLVGTQVRIELIRSQLQMIKATIRDHRREPGSDLVIIYYRGTEKVGEKGNIFQTSPLLRELNAKEFGLDFDVLVEELGTTTGAHLLFLDVDRDEGEKNRDKDKIARIVIGVDPPPGAAGEVAVIRYAWLGPGSAPRDAGLISAMQEAFPRSTKLKDVTDQLRRFAAARQPRLQGDLYVAAELLQLLIGAAP
jgi:hypothetical protein